MKRLVIPLTLVAALFCVTLVASAQERPATPTSATYVTTTVDQSAVMPIRWYGRYYRPYYYGYGYRPYYYPRRYYYGGPYWDYGYPYGYGFSYYGPRRWFSFGF